MAKRRKTRSGAGERGANAVVLRRARHLSFLAVAATIVAIAAGALVQRGRGSTAVSLTIAGRVARVAEGTTLGEAVASAGAQPRLGDRLNVEGKLPRRGTFAGAPLLDGRPARAETRLRSGDRIALADGRDRREPLSTRFARVPRGAPDDPQFSLARISGEQVVGQGAISHKRVSVESRPSGRARTVAPAVALTFDDGPSPRYTPRVLAILRRLRVPATFFVVGYLADQNPGLVRRELRAGMAIGNHRYNHPEVPPFDELPRRLLEDEIVLGAESLSRLGARPSLFRPPGGSSSPAVVDAAEAAGERVVLWSVDPRDWRPGVRPRQIVRRVLGAVRAGSIVLLHDGGGDRSATVAALPAIVKGIRSRRFRLVAIAPR